MGTPITGAQLGQLSDVNVSSLAEGQILKYDFSEGEWVNASLPILAIGSLTQSESNGYTVLNISQNPSFSSISSAADVTVGGDILLTGSSAKLIRPLDIGQSAGPLTIQSNGDLVIELDQDNNEPYKAFIVKNGGDAEVFRVTEEGNVTINQQYVLPSSDGGTDYFLKTDGSGQLYFATLYGTSGNTGGSPPPAIDTLVELLDTDISNLQDNQIIRYDSVSGKWLNEDLEALPAGGTTGQALVKASGTDYDVQWADIAIDVQYHQRYATEAETLRSGATETVELYFFAQGDGNGLAESASSDTPTSGYDIRRKLYYAEKAQADPDTSADWTQFTAIADNTTFNNAKAALLAYLKERTGGTVPISLKMTWEEVSQTAYLLDQSYGSGAEAAYSTRQLRNAATDCMVIRRASDSTTTTIGFLNGDIDESAIETFCTGTTCTVYQWLDQSGNGNDATAASTTEEPTIYTGGALVKQDGRVALDFDGTNNWLPLSDYSITNASNKAVFVVAKNEETGTVRRRAYSIQASGSTRVAFWNDDNNTSNWTGNGFANSVSITGDVSNRHLLTGQDYASSQSIYLNGATGGTNSSGGTNSDANAGYIGTFTNTGVPQAYYGKILELITYHIDKSTDRTDIEENIRDYFTQNTPLLDTYTGAAAAYSLRKLRSAYNGSAVEVYNGSSYADIGFNVFGELDTVALAAHCGSNDGFVSKWYDQSGGTIGDLVQTSTSLMRKIYDGATGYLGYLEKVGSGGYYRPSASSTISQPFSIFGVYDFGGLPDDYFIDSYGSTNRVAILDDSIQNGTLIYDGGGIYGARNITGTTITSAVFNGANSAVSVNGETAVTGTLTGNFDFITLGARYTGTGTSAVDKIYEFVLYENAKNDADRVGIQDNLNSYYSAY